VGICFQAPPARIAFTRQSRLHGLQSRSGYVGGKRSLLGVEPVYPGSQSVQLQRLIRLGSYPHLEEPQGLWRRCAVPDIYLLQISQHAAFRNLSPLPSSGIKVRNPFSLAPVDGVSSVGVITTKRKPQMCTVGLCISLTWKKWSHQLYNYPYLSAENVIMILACNIQLISAMNVPSVLHVFRCRNHIYIKVKGSRNRPGVAQRVPGGLGSQIPWHSAHEGGEIVSPTHRLPLPPGNFPGTHFHWGLSRPQAHGTVGSNMSLKNPVTPPGIDPGTVRLVAQGLNHYATPGPTIYSYKHIKSECMN
jgi:hypothetical protein